ncbi:MAG: FMN-dependent NADH-azoreductase [Planctomycetes bacterium HGW-Planctomycetes-1]|nr:MAG: FMN-dependent NADH-azoreductase [Planctomycetes bacterium HGW-Planctomycetes-1]
MKTLLYIKSSPRTDRSHSHTAAKAFLSVYQQKNPQDKIVTIALFAQSLPEFDNFAAESKYAIMHGREKTAEQVKKWTQIEKIIEQFKSADKYLISTPMWNFGIPYKLKHYIDIIVQPGYTFSAEHGSYKGLAGGKPLCIIYARGGSYDDNSPMDFQKKYLDLIFGFIGFTDIKTIICQPTLADEKTSADAQSAAVEAARKTADFF